MANNRKNQTSKPATKPATTTVRALATDEKPVNRWAFDPNDENQRTVDAWFAVKQHGNAATRFQHHVRYDFTDATWSDIIGLAVSALNIREQRNMRKLSEREIAATKTPAFVNVHATLHAPRSRAPVDPRENAISALVKVGFTRDEAIATIEAKEKAA